MANRIHEYLTDEDAYRGWVNTVVLLFHYAYERPIAFTPLIRQNCRAMFDNDMPPIAAAQWISDVYKLNNPYKPKANHEENNS